MGSGNFPRNAKSYFSFRALLISMNRDLFSIGRCMQSEKFDTDHYDEFEYLVMALEDRRYLKHRGVDVLSILREFIKMVRGKKHGGASTIDMQMVRTLTNHKELTIKRKIYEMSLAFLVNFRYTKRQIMTCYMDNAFFGSHLTGVSSVCREVYNKSMDELDTFDKASIAAMLLRPRPVNPDEKWKSFIKSRAAYAQAVRKFVKKSNN